MKHTFTYLLFFVLITIGKTWGQNANTDIYDSQKVQEIAITFPEKNWKTLLDSLRFNGNGLLTGALQINGVKIGNVGIRYRDGHVFQPLNTRNTLHIQLDHVDKGIQVQGYHSLRLSMALRDPSMVREVLTTEIARKYFPAPKSNYAKVSINGDYYGLFVNIEPVEGPFLERHFQQTTGSLFQSYPYKTDSIGKSGCLKAAYGSLQLERNDNCYGENFLNLRGSGYQEITELSRVLNQEPQKIESILDVDRTLWMLAFNNVLVNLNSYTGGKAQGYYLYKDANGQFSPLVADYNLTFGSLKNIGRGSDLTIPELQQLDPLLHADNTYRPLISKLLSNPYYVKVYLSHMRTILFNEFLSGAYEIRAKQLQEQIRPILAQDANRSYPATDFDRSLMATIGKVTQIPGIVEFMNERSRFLKKHPALIVIPPAMTDLKVKHREKFVATQIDAFNIQVKAAEYTSKVKAYYRFGPQESFKEIVLMDDGQHGDEKAGDMIYGVVIKPNGANSRLEYYLIAENAKLVSHSPENYMFQRHQVSLEELNK